MPARSASSQLAPAITLPYSNYFALRGLAPTSYLLVPSSKYDDLLRDLEGASS